MKKSISVALLAIFMIALQVGCSIDKVALKNIDKDKISSVTDESDGSISVVKNKNSEKETKRKLDVEDENSGSQVEKSQTTKFAMPTNEQINKLNQLENKSKGWGQGIQYDENNCPITVVPFNKAYGKYGGLAISDERETKNITITFDQGYENGYTPKILDALKEKKISAVFFVTMDYAKRNDELMKRMIDEGHIIGNHTANHPSMPTRSVEQNIEDIALLHNYILDNYSYDMTVLRPPMGEFSSRTLETAHLMGYKTIMWSFAYKDWDPKNQMGAEAAKKKVIGAAHNGAIYLLHAVSKDNATILGDVIDNLTQKGFTFDIRL